MTLAPLLARDMAVVFPIPVLLPKEFTTLYVINRNDIYIYGDIDMHNVCYNRVIMNYVAVI